MVGGKGNSTTERSSGPHPTAGEHLTTPGSRLLFPELSAPTTTVTPTGRPAPHTAGLTMPRRTTTRTEDRAARIAAERELNEADGGGLARMPTT